MDRNLEQLKESWKQLLEKEILVGGKADNMTIQSVAAYHAGANTGKRFVTMYYLIKEQVEMGMEVEKEHSPDPKIRLEITLDHLVESPTYYTDLAKVHKD